MKYIIIIITLFLLSFSGISYAQNSPGITGSGAGMSLVNIIASTAWKEVKSSFRAGMVVNVATGAASSICFVRHTQPCSTITDVSSCPIQLAPDTSFEFLANEDRYNGRVCARRLSGSGAISVGINTW
jgi:hypothetical protein